MVKETVRNVLNLTLMKSVQLKSLEDSTRFRNM
jgi:hypothetical protein